MKKNHILSAVAAVASVFCFSSAKAQLGIGGQIAGQTPGSYASFTYVTPTSLFGLGPNLFYNMGDGKMRLKMEVNYMFPASKDLPIAFTGTGAGTIGVLTSTTTLSNVNIPLNFSYAFVGNLNEEGFALYGFAGLDLNIYHIKNTIKGGSSTGSDTSASKSYFGVNPHIGLGAEYGINDKLRLFLDLKYCFGKSAVNSAATDEAAFLNAALSGNNDYKLPLYPDSFNPAYFGWSVGVRYMLGEK